MESGAFLLAATLAGAIRRTVGTEFYTLQRTGEGFAVGAVSSLAGSGMQAVGVDAALIPLGCGLAGAGTAALTGGDVFAGFMTGYGIGEYNHVNGEKKVRVGPNGHPLEEVTVTAKMPAKFKSAPWMLVAKGQLGQTEKNPGNNSFIVAYHSTTGKFKDDETPWCSSFVNWSFTQVGINGTNSARAYSWNNWGQTLTEPAYGAVAVMNYSHVGFVEGINNDGRLILLGGNQGKPGAVNYSPNSINSVVTYRYPNGYVPNYNLPSYNMRGRSLNLSSTR